MSQAFPIGNMSRESLKAPQTSPSALPLPSTLPNVYFTNKQNKANDGYIQKRDLNDQTKDEASRNESHKDIVPMAATIGADVIIALLGIGLFILGKNNVINANV